MGRAAAKSADMAEVSDHAANFNLATRPHARGYGGVAAWTLVLAVCLFSAVAGRLGYLGRPFDSDAAMFIYMGKLVAEGGRVGRDVVDNKFPTVGLLTSGAWRALGTNWPAYVTLGVGLSAGAAAALGAAAVRAVGPRGCWPAVLFAALFLNFTPVVFGGFQLETPIACLACLAAMAAVRAIDDDSPAAAFVAGLAAGCGMLLKPTGAGVLGAMAVGLIVRQLGAARAPAGRPLNLGDIVHHASEVDPPRPAANPAGMSRVRNGLKTGLSALAGLAVPLSAAAAYVSTAGLWADLPVTAHRLAAYAHGSVFDAVSWIKLATAAAVVGFPLIVRGVVGRSRYTAEEPPAGAASPAVRAFAVAWLVIEIVGVVAQRRMYAYHFLPVVPPAALLFGMLRRPTRPLPLLAALGPAAALGWVCALQVIATPSDDRLPVGRYLLARAARGERVWADDWPRLLLETGLRPGSRQALTFLFANDDTTAAADSAQIVADLIDRRPTFVLLPADLPAWLGRQTSGIVELAQHPTRAAAYTAGWHRIERYTLAHYRREAVVGEVAVYRRDAGVADDR